MLDVEPIILEELRRLSPPEPELAGDWGGVIGAVGASRAPRYVLAVAAAVAGLVAIGSALGAAGIGPLAPIKSWLQGTPGRPAPPAAVRRFRRANGRSWASFPRSTQLRELITHSFGGQRYVLYGFRSGNSVCLTLRAVTLRSSLGPACAPVSVVEELSAPVVPVAGDRTVEAFPERRSAQVSFGIAADQVRRVDVLTVDGSHRAAIGGNAYLWVDPTPPSFDRVEALAVAAGGASGRVPVGRYDPTVLPLAPAAVQGPTHVQETIRDPRIGWVRRGEKRGLSLREAHLTPQQSSGLVPSYRAARFFKPDPSSDVVVGFDGGCLYLAGGASCIDTPEMFARGPLWYMVAGGGGPNSSDEFSTVGGVAADGVAAVRAFLPDGSSLRLPLSDNVFAGVIPGLSPYRIVAYASDGKVVGIDSIGRNATAPAAARSLHPALHVRGATLSLGPKVGSVRCWRLASRAGRNQGECDVQPLTGPWVALQGVQAAGDAVFVFGRARGPVARTYLAFEDGSRVRVALTDGWFLGRVPERELSTARRRARLLGVTRTGRIVQQPAFFYARAE